MGGDSLAKSIFDSALVGTVFGTLVGAFSTAWRTQSPGVTTLYRSGVHSIRGQAALFALVGVSYTVTEGATASLLNHKGVVPTVLGGTAAGTVLGFAAKSPRLAVTSSILLSAGMLLANASDGRLSQAGERQYKKYFNHMLPKTKEAESE